MSPNGNRRAAPRWWKRLLAATVSLALALAALEFGFFAYQHVRFREPPAPLPASGKPPLTIVCAGDSYVQGVGASSAVHAYPAQLEQILAQRLPGRAVQVVNIGSGGHNTSEVLDDLQKALPRLPRRPELVVVTCGINNFWNLHLSSALEEGYAELPVSKRWLRKLEAAHVGKMAVILWENARSLARQLAAQENWLSEEQKSVSLFDEKNPVEMAFVRAWIQHDLVAIGHAVQAACARPVFTQYVIGKTNELVAQTARDNDFAVCPSPGHSDIWEKAEQFAADGWHLNDRGYAAYARKVADCVAPFVGE